MFTSFPPGLSCCQRAWWWHHFLSLSWHHQSICRSAGRNSRLWRWNIWWKVQNKLFFYTIIFAGSLSHLMSHWKEIMLLTCNVIYNHSHCRIPYIAWNEASKALLSSCVPQLQSYLQTKTLAFSLYCVKYHS